VNRWRIAFASYRRALIIVGAALAETLATVRPRLPAGLPLWIHGPGAADMAPLAPELARQPTGPPALSDFVPPSHSMARRCISIPPGTTGLPKAAAVSHYRVMQWSQWFAGMLDTQPDGPDVRLPAAVPQRGRRGGGRSDPGRRRQPS
jgi:fatty-acyl-CoA synthase